MVRTSILTGKLRGGQTRILRESAGFSLIAMLLMALTMGIVSLGAIGLLESARKGGQVASAKAGQLGLMQEIRALLSNSTLCINALQNKRMNTGGNTDLSFALPDHSPALTIGAGVSLKAYGLALKKVYAENPQFAGTASNGNALWSFALSVEAAAFQAAGGAATQAFQFKKITAGTFIAELDASNALKRCYTLENESDLVQASCDQFRGTYDAATQTCKLPPVLQNTSCPVEEAVVSVVNDIPHCGPSP